MNNGWPKHTKKIKQIPIGQNLSIGLNKRINGVGTNIIAIFAILQKLYQNAKKWSVLAESMVEKI